MSMARPGIDCKHAQGVVDCAHRTGELVQGLTRGRVHASILKALELRELVTQLGDLAREEECQSGSQLTNGGQPEITFCQFLARSDLS